MKTVKVQTDPKTKEAYLNLSDFSEFVDTTKVAYYEMTETKNPPSISLKFFDKDKKLLPTKK